MRSVGFAVIAVVLTFTASSAALTPDEHKRIEEIVGHSVTLNEPEKHEGFRALAMLSIGFGIGIVGSATFSFLRKRFDNKH